jgi:hypothetical protein
MHGASAGTVPACCVVLSARCCVALTAGCAQDAHVPASYCMLRVVAGGVSLLVMFLCKAIYRTVPCDTVCWFSGARWRSFNSQGLLTGTGSVMGRSCPAVCWSGVRPPRTGGSCLLIKHEM